MNNFLNSKSLHNKQNQGIPKWGIALVWAFIYGVIFMGISAHHVAAKEIVAGLDVTENRYQHHRYIDATIDLEKLSLSQHWIDPAIDQGYASFNNFNSAVRKQNQKLLFAVNSGIYTKEYTPLGLYIENKQLLTPLNLVKSNEGQGNFALLPNGVFYITDKNRAYIVDTDRFHEQFQGQYESIKDAVQSGPMLIINGEYNPYFIPKSDSLRIRSGVCASDNGRKVTFVVTEDRVNFYEFATYFKEKLQCNNALYLDGTLARMTVNGRVYGASFWQAKPLVGIWSVIQTP